MIITLTADEGLAASSASALQMMRAIQKGWVGTDHGEKGTRDLRDRWADAILGGMAEYAVCKALNRCWSPGISGLRDCDIKPDIHVRSTPHKNGHLIIFKEEIDKYADDKFILVTGHWPTLTIAGFTFGRTAKQETLLRTMGNQQGYWVPQHQLTPLNPDWTASRYTPSLEET